LRTQRGKMMKLLDGPSVDGNKALDISEQKKNRKTCSIDDLRSHPAIQRIRKHSGKFARTSYPITSLNCLSTLGLPRSQNKPTSYVQVVKPSRVTSFSFQTSCLKFSNLASYLQTPYLSETWLAGFREISTGELGKTGS